VSEPTLTEELNSLYRHYASSAHVQTNSKKLVVKKAIARIDELEADLIRYRERSEKVTKQCITLNTRIDELEADKPISLKFKDNGQVWIAFDAGGGRQAMISLNNIALKMHDEGITRGIVLDAIARNSGEQE
jgi:hypothetical protein